MEGNSGDNHEYTRFDSIKEIDETGNWDSFGNKLIQQFSPKGIDNKGALKDKTRKVITSEQ